jgi:hypothetical protein
MMRLLPQEIPLTDPKSSYFFRPSPDKPFVATTNALDAFGVAMIVSCLSYLQRQAVIHRGLDWLQVFQDSQTHAKLYFIEDGPGGCVNALLPSDY